MDMKRADDNLTSKFETETGADGVTEVGKIERSNMISVNQDKLDALVDIMGEIVITESMVASNPDLQGLQLDNFNKSARQLRKLTDQLQDIVMSIRMMPLSGVFQKMGRTVRDANQKYGKDVKLVHLGGEVEVDKSISDILDDPIRRLISNAVEHGIELPEERKKAGKSEDAAVTLRAENVGSDIVITVRDNGRGMDVQAILDIAEQKGLLSKSRTEYSSREAHALVMAHGFTTESPERGEGLYTVRRSIEKVGGSVHIDSEPGNGTLVYIKIPLSLAIVDGMEVGVADSTFTIPITSINQIYKLSAETELLYDTDGTEMVMVRGINYPIVRLHRIYGMETNVTELADGILIIVEGASSFACIFADRLLGEQQVVVKTFPRFFDRYNLKELGLSGCTIMGDGSISLILDINTLLGSYRNDANNMMHIS